MTPMTTPATRVLLGVRGMNKEAGIKVAETLSKLPGVMKANPDVGQIEVHYDPTMLTVMDLVRAVRTHGFLAGML